MRAWVIAIAIAAGGWYYYHHHRTAQASLPSLQEPAISASQFPATPALALRCEGKTMCHQMQSCEEATFYLRNCPGTKIDGDGDGIPCERSLC
ncbi:excalibur calcium-binding domain-containing protein [Cupriavidus plantarum]|uniref:excalibur calcium-binding domain-containing protein n=1 Tax=Cupriavidus plantarum TaxID=942865 RepID=UPI000E23255C